MKIIKYIPVSILMILVYSCSEPMLLNPGEVERGIFVTYVSSNGNINSGDIAGTPISGIFDAPAGNVASLDVFVQRIYNFGESESDFLLLRSITEFPYEFSVDGNELAALFGVSVEETFGNFYQFNCEATGKNGQIATYDNLEAELVGSADQHQGFRFRGAVVCPSDPNVIVGTYDALTSGNFPDFGDFTDFAYVITITATDEEGFYTISDYSFGTYDFYYGPWYGGGDLPGTIQDVCGIFFITDTYDPWGETVSGDFTFNDDGTITVVGGTSYGETWTAVLTRQ
jgi:hypothetical protein